nr:MAG TPA: hypothetical protein [Caudoviricetes sp.]
MVEENRVLYLRKQTKVCVSDLVIRIMQYSEAL